MERDASVMVLPLDIVLSVYQDGDEHGWDEEFADLLEHDGPALAALARSVKEDGIKEPVVLGPDGRVWDGHHRLLVARLLGLSSVPCVDGAGR